MASEKDSIREVDENGVVRYRRPPGVQKRNQASPRGRTLTDGQIDGTENITKDDLSNALGGVSVDNILKGRSHGYKKRNGMGRARTLDAMLRRAKALELRRAGFTWQEIANRKSLGYTSAGNVQKDVHRLLQQMLDTPAQEVLAIELSRLDAITQALWQQVRNGDLPAIDRIYSAMRIRHSLLGLDQININHTMVTVNDLDREIERLTAEMKKYDEGARDSGGTSISDQDELEEARKAAGL